MKKFALFALSFIFIASVSNAQKFHTPVEILKKVSDSKLMYNVSALEDSDIKPDTSENNLVGHGIYLETNIDGSKSLRYYNDFYASDKDMGELLSKAEEYFRQDKRADARQAYLKILDKMPSNSQIMTYIGQCYEADESESQKCLDWYTKAIQANYFDYMAHWFKASYSSRNGDIQTSVDEILKAHILNRNNPRLKKEMAVILKKAGLRMSNMDFRPRYAVYKDDNGNIQVKFDSIEAKNMVYSFCKSLWQFEPGYAGETMDSSGKLTDIVEEKECFMNMLMVYESSESSDSTGKFRKIPKYEKLKDIFYSGNADSFVIYEVLLKDHPNMIFLLNKDGIDSIADYVRKYRVLKYESTEDLPDSGSN